MMMLDCMVSLQICQLDSEAIRVSALQAMFDIILVHGVDFLQDKTSISMFLTHPNAINLYLLARFWRRVLRGFDCFTRLLRYGLFAIGIRFLVFLTLRLSTG